MRRSQIAKWKSEPVRDEPECETIVLSATLNANRPRRRFISDAERRQNEIDRRKKKFLNDVAFRWPKHSMLQSNLITDGKKIGIGFIAVNLQNKNEKIIESFFFGSRY